MYSVASKDDYVPPAVKEKKKTKGGKMGIATQPEVTTESAAAADASSSTADDEWSQDQQVREAIVASRQNLIPSFPWIASGWRERGAIEGKEGMKFCIIAQRSNSPSCTLGRKRTI